MFSILTITNTDHMSYRNLDIYKTALELFLKTHKASFLPKYELFESGNQLRRSSDSVIQHR